MDDYIGFKRRFLKLVQEKFDGKHTRLAREAGISPSTLQNWKDTNTFNPNGFAVAKIAQACGVTADWLLTGREAPAQSPPNLDDLKDLMAKAIDRAHQDPDLAGHLRFVLKKALE